MASIHPRVRADGTINYAVKYRVDGVQTSQPFDNEKAAKAFKAAVEAYGPVRACEMYDLALTPRRERKINSGKGITVGQWCRQYIDSLTGMDQKSLDQYEGYLRHNIEPYFGNTELATLTEADIANWVKYLETLPGRGGKRQAPKTIANKHGFLSAALSAAVPRYLSANPAAGRKLPQGDGDPHEPVYLTHADFDVLLKSITPFWQPLVEFLVASGLRWSEATALRPADVERSTGRVRVRRAWKHSHTKGYYIGPPKTKRSRRDVHVPVELLDRLDFDNEWLFVNRAGRHVLHRGFIDRVWNPAVTRAGLTPRPTPHDLRHTHASWLLNAGVPIAVVSRRLGHENIQTTVNIYGHIDTTSDEAASDAIADILSKAP